MNKKIITDEASEIMLKKIQPAINSRQGGSVILYFDESTKVFWEHSISTESREAQLESLSKTEVNLLYTDNFGNMMNKKGRC